MTLFATSANESNKKGEKRETQNIIVSACIVLYFDAVRFYDHKAEIKAYYLHYAQSTPRQLKV